MGKVYSSDLRTQDEELERLGRVSEKTRLRASSAWVPDFSTFDFLEEFLRWEGVTFKELQRLQGEWRKLGSPIGVKKEGFEYLLRQSGFASRNPTFDKRVEDEDQHQAQNEQVACAKAKYKLSKEEKGKLEILKQFYSFRDKQLALAGTQKTKPIKISMLDVLCGLATICKGTLEQKAGFIFATFDFERNRTLSADEVKATLAATIRGYATIKGAPIPDEQGLEWLFEKSFAESVLKARLAKGKSIEQAQSRTKYNMQEYVSWCKKETAVESFLMGGSTIGTGGKSAFADRKKAEQKKILGRLAKVESALELMGEEAFDGVDLMEMLQVQALFTRAKEDAIQDQTIVSDDEIDESEVDEVKQKEERNQDGAGMRSRRKAQLVDIALYNRVPGLKSFQPVFKEVLDEMYKGLSALLYSGMLEEERKEWADSTRLMIFITECVERVFASSDVPNCNAQSLIELAQNCGVYCFDGFLEKLSSQSDFPVRVDIPVLVQWIRSWPAPDALIHRKSAGQYWAWARLLVGLGAALFKVTWWHVKEYGFSLIEAALRQTWIDRDIKLFGGPVPRTLLRCTICDDYQKEDPVWGLQACVSFRRFFTATKRVIEYDNPPTSLAQTQHSQSGNQNTSSGKDEDEDEEEDEEEDEQLEFEKSQVESCLLLQRGKEMYQKVFHKLPTTQRGSLARAGLDKSESIGMYAVIDFETSPGAAKEDVTLAAFKLKVLFTHEYLSKWLSGKVAGVHVTEYCEFVGSVRTVRFILFFHRETSSVWAELLQRWLKNVESASACLAVALGVERVFQCPWDGALTSLWNFDDQEQDGVDFDALAKSAIERERVGMHKPRRHAVDVSLLQKLGAAGGVLSGGATEGAEGVAVSMHRARGPLEATRKSTRTRLTEREVKRLERSNLQRKSLTQYGFSCVESILRAFDRDGDGALNLVEMNELLKTLGMPTFTTHKDMRATFQEDDLELDVKGYANIKTLAQLYTSAPAGDLAKDLGTIGVMNSSLAGVPFQMSVDIKAPVVASRDDIDAVAAVSELGKVFSAATDGTWLEAAKSGIWRSFASQTEVEMHFQHWTSFWRENEETIKKCIPEEWFGFFHKVLFEAAFARNLLSDAVAILQGLLASFDRAQFGCQDDEHEMEEEEHIEGEEGEVDDMEIGKEKSKPAPPDFTQRALLKMIFHLLKSFKGVLLGVKSARVTFSNEMSLDVELEGAECFEWILAMSSSI